MNRILGYPVVKLTGGLFSIYLDMGLRDLRRWYLQDANEFQVCPLGHQEALTVAGIYREKQVVTRGLAQPSHKLVIGLLHLHAFVL